MPTPMEGKLDRNWAEVHATHIARWDAHTAIADAPPLHGEMSYNDKYMVESQLKIMVKCELGSKIYTDYINALKAVEKISRLTLDDARAVGNTSEPTVGRGQQASGCQGHGGHQSSQRHTSSRRPTSSRHHIPMHDYTMEETSQIVNEMCFDTGYDMGCDATGRLPSMAHNDVGPSHTFAHRDTSRSPSMVCDDTCSPTSSTTSLLPTTRTSPPQTTSTAPTDVRGRDKMRFMFTPRRPTPGAVPPEFVHTELIQTKIPTPSPEASHIEDWPRRLQRTQTHPPYCGIGHGKVRLVKEPIRRRKRG
uniref:Uncharacterized protein n=1 Tax=Quercus lobata TaxID=97700 RepID=A0A7N2M3Q8_QUELO